MANLVALLACFNVFLLAVFGLMPHLVAFETHLLGAIKRIVFLTSTQDASLLLPFIWAICLHVAELEAIVALDGRIDLRPIPLAL